NIRTSMHAAVHKTVTTTSRLVDGADGPARSHCVGAMADGLFLATLKPASRIGSVIARTGAGPRAPCATHRAQPEAMSQTPTVATARPVLSWRPSVPARGCSPELGLRRDAGRA